MLTRVRQEHKLNRNQKHLDLEKAHKKVDRMKQYAKVVKELKQNNNIYTQMEEYRISPPRVVDVSNRR